MNDFDKWAEGWNDGMLNDPDNSVRVARAAAHAARLEGRDAARDDLIQCLLATRGQSEGATADAILSMFTAPQPAEQQPSAGDSLTPVPDEVFAAEFAAWWEEHGQFCRAGGGPYEQSFAFEAWRHLYPKLMKLQKVAEEQQPAPDVTGLVDALERVMYCNEVKFLPEDVQQAVSDALAAYRKQGGE